MPDDRGDRLPLPPDAPGPPSPLPAMSQPPPEHIGPPLAAIANQRGARRFFEYAGYLAEQLGEQMDYCGLMLAHIPDFDTWWQTLADMARARVPNTPDLHERIARHVASDALRRPFIHDFVALATAVGLEHIRLDPDGTAAAIATDLRLPPARPADLADKAAAWERIQRGADEIWAQLFAAYVEHIVAVAGEGRDQAPHRRPPAPILPGLLPSPFRDGAARIPTHSPILAMLEAFHNGEIGKGWTDYEGQRAPTYQVTTNRKSRRPGAIYVSVRAGDGALTPLGDVLPRLWDQVRALDDLASDVLLFCIAQCAGQSDDLSVPVWVTADAILDARGVQRIRRQGEPGNWQHGHRTEDRLAVGRALAQLDSVWLEIMDVEVIPERKRRKGQRLTHESRALTLLDRVTQHDLTGNQVLLAARVLPGTWAQAYKELGLRPFGLLMKKALEYNPYRERPQKRLAKYFAFHYRWNAATPTLRRTVADLLETAGIEPEPANPQRTKSRLHKALDRLQADGVVGRWNAVIDDTKLPAKGWLPHWLQTIVEIERPGVLDTHYARFARPA